MKPSKKALNKGLSIFLVIQLLVCPDMGYAVQTSTSVLPLGMPKSNHSLEWSSINQLDLNCLNTSGLNVSCEALWNPRVEKEPLLILLEDAHSHQGIQSGIENLLETLHKTGEVNHFFLEGALGRLGSDKNFTNGSEKEKRWIAKLTGAERFFIENATSARAWGTESAKLYRSNLVIKREIMSRQPNIEKYLRENEMIYRNQLRQHLKAEGRELLDLWLDYERTLEIEPLLDFISRQVDQDKVSENLAKVIGLQAWSRFQPIEKMNGVSKLIDSSIENIYKSLGLDQQGKFNASNLETSHRSLRNRLEGAEYDHPGFLDEISQYPNLARDIRIKTFLSELDKPVLQVELNEWIEENLQAHLTSDQKERLTLYFDFQLWGKMLKLQVSAEEYTEIVQDPDRFTAERFYASRNEEKQLQSKLDRMPDRLPTEWTKKAHQFYKLANMRNQSLTERPIERMKRNHIAKALILAGGYHSNEIREIAMAQNIDLITVRMSPSIADTNVNTSNVVDPLMLNPQPMLRYFSQGKALSESDKLMARNLFSRERASQRIAEKQINAIAASLGGKGGDPLERSVARQLETTAFIQRSAQAVIRRALSEQVQGRPTDDKRLMASFRQILLERMKPSDDKYLYRLSHLLEMENGSWASNLPEIGAEQAQLTEQWSRKLVVASAQAIREGQWPFARDSATALAYWKRMQGEVRQIMKEEQPQKWTPDVNRREFMGILGLGSLVMSTGGAIAETALSFAGPQYDLGLLSRLMKAGLKRRLYRSFYDLGGGNISSFGGDWKRHRIYQVLSGNLWQETSRKLDGWMGQNAEMSSYLFHQLEGHWNFMGSRDETLLGMVEDMEKFNESLEIGADFTFAHTAGELWTSQVLFAEAELSLAGNKGLMRPSLYSRVHAEGYRKGDFSQDIPKGGIIQDMQGEHLKLIQLVRGLSLPKIQTLYQLFFPEASKVGMWDFGRNFDPMSPTSEQTVSDIFKTGKPDYAGFQREKEAKLRQSDQPLEDGMTREEQMRKELSRLKGK